MCAFVHSNHTHACVPYSSGSEHETTVTGFNLAGEAVPPVWVLNVARITPAIRDSMRAIFADPRTHMWFNGRWIIPCACVAGGKKGGVSRDNIRNVMMEMERYLDGNCYVRGSTWEDRIPDEEWQPKSPIFQFTDWHNSRTSSEFLMMQVFMHWLDRQSYFV